MKIRSVMGVAAALCCSGLAMTASAAELCTDAGLSPVTVGTTTGNFTGSTNDGPTGCGGTGNLNQWFEFTPANTAKYTISLCGSAQGDTVLGVSLSTALCTGAATYIQCNDDACGLGSEITPTLTAGTSYRLRVASFGAVTNGGGFSIIITQQSGTAPAGDLCASPITAASGSNPGTLVGATDSAFNANSCAGTVDFNDVYYTFTSTVAGSHRFSVCTGDFDAVVSLHTACPVSSVVTNQIASACATSANAPVVGCGLRGATLVSTLTLGQVVIIRIAGASDATGTGSPFVGFGGYDLNIILPPTPVANNTCGANAGSFTIPGGGGTATQSIADGTWTNDGTACSGSGADVYYYFTPSATSTFLIDLCTGGNFDSVLSVHNNTCPVSSANYANGQAAAVACSDDVTGCGTGTSSRLSSVTLTGGTPYIIRVARFSGTTAATFTLTVTALAVPGACCNNATGVCTVVTSTACATSGGTYQGDGTTCPNANCPASGSCCVGQCCAVLTAASCSSVNGTFTDGGTCAAGSCTAVVANDDCSAAIGIAVGTPIVGCNIGATLAAGEPVPTCQATYNASVWYSFTPATSGFYNAATCGANFDSVLSILTSPDCVVYSPVACDDDACPGGEAGAFPGSTGNGLASLITAAQLTGGQLYYARVAGFSTAVGSFRLLVSPNTTAGACCNATTGACTVSNTGAPGCTAGTTFVGGTCLPTNPCPQPTGACCNADGTCTIGPASACINGGLFQSVGSTCTGPGSGGCPVLVGACCNNTTGNCGLVVSGACATGSTYSGDGSVCSPNTCPQPGTCCIGNCCTVTLPAGCSGVFTAGGTCTPGACGTPSNDECLGATAVVVGANAGSNCGATTSFVITPPTQCGTFSGSGGENDVWHSFTPTQSANYTFSTCNAANSTFDSTLALYSACPANGGVAPDACNDDTDGTCAVNALASEIPDRLLIAGTTYFIRVAAYAGSGDQQNYILTITQGAAAGACCTGTSCAIVLGFNCASGYQGDFSSCSPNPCLPQTGACCCGSTCSLTAMAGCNGANTSFSGTGTACNAFGVNNTTPCCFADYNQSGTVGVQDIFDFLAAYFGMDGCADINASGPPPSVQDIFDYLATYFAGCP